MFSQVGWLLILLLTFGDAGVQKDDHINWRFSSLGQSGSEWKLLFTASIDSGWHLYSQSIEEGGPMPTSFVFKNAEGYRLVGETKEAGDSRTSYDSTFMMNVSWYEDHVVFSQKVKAKRKTKVAGEIAYAVCSEDVCTPGTVRFSIDVGN